MKDTFASVEEKIVFHTIQCIEQYGMSGATNRRIAQMAGVNIAAINYYFRSKDVLIQRCMEITLKNAFDLSDFPPMRGASAPDFCIAILMNLFEGGFRYPNLSRAHFYKLLAEGQYDPLLVEHISRFIDELATGLHDRGCALEMDELKLALIQIVLAVMLAILAPALFEQHHGINLRDPDTCLAYVTRLVSRLLT